MHACDQSTFSCSIYQSVDPWSYLTRRVNLRYLAEVQTLGWTLAAVYLIDKFFGPWHVLYAALWTLGIIILGMIWAAFKPIRS